MDLIYFLFGKNGRILIKRENSLYRYYEVN